MSEAPSERELRTPMPRQGQESGYFRPDVLGSSYGITSLDTMADTSDGSALDKVNSAGRLLAQQELASRAISPQAENSSHSSPASLCSEKVPIERAASIKHVNLSDSMLSSRPGTPVSLPSMLPIPSNPSSLPEDRQTMSPGPALVMPSIHISPRRPYSDNGRRIGKLRVIFCGDSGSGKTTLLRTIADLSPDIVHSEDTQGSEPGRTTTEINEVRASSQPYPPWRILSSAGSSCSDAVMERNICLIDTPGYALSAEADDAIYPILRYVEAQFHNVNDVVRDNGHLNNEDFLSLIASPQGGLTQLDVAVYCITKFLTEIDMTFIHNLSQFTTVIPVITKTDLAPSDSEALQSTIHSQLQAMNFSFFQTCTTSTTHQPFLISCIDPEIEASIMMRDDYTPNLIPSDLQTLMTTLFQDPHPARLRHETARKFIAWKTRQQTQQSLIRAPEQEMVLLPSADFTISRMAEHTRREDSKTRVRIAAWAHEMRSSFALTTGQDPVVTEKSASWLLTRMNDYVEEEKRADGARRARGRYHLKNEGDPFGLLRLRERWSRRFKRTFKWLCDVSFTSCGLYLLYNLWERVSVLE